MHPILPNRKIEGISAILLPFHADGAIEWEAFCAHVARTADAGLIPAVNMDTGYANLIDDHTRLEVLRLTRATLSNRPFVAGAFVSSQAGDRYDAQPY
jgi:dihydrodipicolinate synthase/N-acetylneuraminate lyase